MDLFSIHELADMVRELGYKNGEPIYLHFHTPGTELDFGLMPLVTDGDVNNMSKYVKENKVLHIYIEHGQSTLNEPIPYFYDANEGHLLEDDTKLDSFEGLNFWETNLDDDDLFSMDDKSEDGIIDGSNTNNEESSDLLYDENNILNEPEVDMTDFISVFDQEVDRDPSTIPILDSFDNGEDELNVIDTQVLDSGIVAGDKRKEMLKNLAKPILCSLEEVHQPTFRLGQRFKNKEDVKQLVKLHSIHTKRSLYFEKK
ncbi:unnamed protein product [Lactuca saligna]|uniref:PB1-like domain-containing protein n=1 Tax=Lactuca saligna TaxID=75948 RepID=A0AA36DV14_LACSI|nr:unnamed protein product [Lactuca saligna]